jgi:acetyl-CoA carboxylase biotin carboxyl carrier protein
MSHPVSGAEPLLEAVVRRAAQIEAATSAPVRRVKVQADDMVVEIEWSVAEGAAAHTATAASPGETSAEKDADGRVTVQSPAVGLFYRAPEPGAKPFVEVGDFVEVGQQIGILEAMKLMNPIESEHAGQVIEILAENETPVEYGQPLLVLTADGARPDGD